MAFQESLEVENVLQIEIVIISDLIRRFTAPQTLLDQIGGNARPLQKRLARRAV